MAPRCLGSVGDLWGIAPGRHSSRQEGLLLTRSFSASPCLQGSGERGFGQTKGQRETERAHEESRSRPLECGPPLHPGHEFRVKCAMFAKTWMRSALCAGLVLTAASGVTACGGSGPEAKHAQVSAGAMPAGGSWQGVYYNQVYGFLHITDTNNAVQGAWRNTNGDKWGELFGEIEGDLLTFTWKEHKIGVVGPNATSEGKGYFKYVVPKEGEAHELRGEWGLGESNSGHSWNCVKQLNQEADPKSVRPDEMESRVGAEGFDGAAGDKPVENVATPPPAAKDEKAPTDEKAPEAEEKPAPSKKKK